MAGSLGRRVVVAAIGIPVAFLFVVWGGWMLAGALAVLGMLGTAEFYRLAGKHAVGPVAIPGYLAAAALPFTTLAYLNQADKEPIWLVLGGAVWLMAVMAAAITFRKPDERPLEAVSVTVFGCLYAGGLPCFVLILRYPSIASSVIAGVSLVFLPLVTTWICDTMAMAGGTLVGGAKLAPTVSPSKTWAGAGAGTVAAAAASFFYGRFVLGTAEITISTLQLILLGFTIGIVGQLGDLAESLFKRQAGVKDSGAFFPGHGGVLDRLDSLYWVLPTTVLVLKLFGTI